MASDPSKLPSSEPDDEGPLPEFRDVPTSDNETAYIAYFDVVLWIADQLVGFEETDHQDTWDEAGRQIRRLGNSDRGSLNSDRANSRINPSGIRPAIICFPFT